MSAVPSTSWMPLRKQLAYPRVWLSLWIAAIIATLVVCLVPLPAIEAPIDHFDKFEHTVGHALLAALAAMVVDSRLALLRAVLVLLALGVVIELLQSQIAWRTGDPVDVLANAVGTLLGASITFTPLARSLIVVERAAQRLGRRGS